MMNFAFMQKPINQYRLGMGVGLVASVGLMVKPQTQALGFIVAAATVVLGLLFAAVFTIKYGLGETRSLFDGGVHPSHGLLTNIPKSFSDMALRVVIYAGALLVTGWMMVYGISDDPFDHIFGASFFVFVATLVPVELMSWGVAARWGSTPPRHVLTGFLAVASLLVLALGLMVASEVLAFLPSVTTVEPEWEALRWVPVGSLLLIVAAIWIRDIMVTGWQGKLAAQAEKVKEAEIARQLAEAQLAMLQAQIEPHFLYNTLASVQYLVRKDAEGADFLLTQLIRYLRHAMPKLRQPMSTLGQEFELADAYLQIARMRMGGRLQVELELAEALHGVPFPPMVLQTLVENAVKHGVEPKAGPVSIQVTARRVDDEVVVQVVDDGAGLGNPTGTAGSGTGLPNIRDRLQGIYGDHAQLSVVGRGRGGVISTVALVVPNAHDAPGAAVAVH